MDSLQLRNLVLAKMAKTEVETKFDNAYHDLALASLAASTDAVPANVVIVGPRATAEDYRKLLGIPANCPTQIRFVKHRDMSDSALPDTTWLAATAGYQTACRMRQFRARPSSSSYLTTFSPSVRTIPTLLMTRSTWS
ncbi:hypothetical protein ACFSQE_18230 [Vogesella fluminis]|uniref:hypothetical protein n=1 Tax=Vogesella fluminis TaxID=1069161 RepID=UPI00362CC431